MALYLPDPKYLKRTGDVDYFHWNYAFPIKYIQKLRFKGIIRLMGNRSYDRILEVGTGSGIFLPELARHCNKLYAIDIHQIRNLYRFASVSPAITMAFKTIRLALSLYGRVVIRLSLNSRIPI